MCKRLAVINCPECGTLIPLADAENVCSECGIVVDGNGRESTGVIPHEGHTILEDFEDEY